MWNNMAEVIQVQHWWTRNKQKDQEMTNKEGKNQVTGTEPENKHTLVVRSWILSLVIRLRLWLENLGCSTCSAVSLLVPHFTVRMSYVADDFHQHSGVKSISTPDLPKGDNFSSLWAQILLRSIFHSYNKLV